MKERPRSMLVPPRRAYPRAARRLRHVFAGLLLLLALPLVGSAPQAEGPDAAAILRTAWEPLYRLDPDVGFDAAFLYRSTKTYRGMSVNGRREETATADGKISYRGRGRLLVDSSAPLAPEARDLLREVMALYETRAFASEFDPTRLLAESDGERTIVRLSDDGAMDLAGSVVRGERQWIAVKDGVVSALQVRYPGPPVATDVLFDFTLSDALDGKKLVTRVIARWQSGRHFERDVTITPAAVEGIPLPGVVELKEIALNQDPDVKSAMSRGGAIGRETSARLEIRDARVVRGIGPPDAASAAGAVLKQAWDRLARVPSTGAAFTARIRADVAPRREGAPTRVRVEGTLRAAFGPGATGAKPIVSLDATADRRCPEAFAPIAVARATALAREALAFAAPASYEREFAGVEARLLSQDPAVRVALAPYWAARFEMPSRDAGTMRFLAESGDALREVRLDVEGETRLPVRVVSDAGVEIVEWTKAGSVFVPARYRTVPVNEGTREDVRLEEWTPL